jgi:hypothetical protein
MRLSCWTAINWSAILVATRLTNTVSGEACQELCVESQTPAANSTSASAHSPPRADQANALSPADLAILNGLISNQLHWLGSILPHADRKAGFLLTLDLALLAYLQNQEGLSRCLGLLRTGSSPHVGVDILASGSVACLVSSVLLITLVLWPRYRPKPDRFVAWPDICMNYGGDSNRYTATILSAGSQEVIRQQLLHLHEQSWIFKAKIRFTRWAFAMAFAGFSLAFVFLVVSKK